MTDDKTKAERRERKRRKDREMLKSGRSFVVSVSLAVRKRLGFLKARKG